MHLLAWNVPQGWPIGAFVYISTFTTVMDVAALKELIEPDNLTSLPPAFTITDLMMSLSRYNGYLCTFNNFTICFCFECHQVCTEISCVKTYLNSSETFHSFLIRCLSHLTDISICLPIMHCYRGSSKLLHFSYSYLIIQCEIKWTSTFRWKSPCLWS